MIRDGQAQRKCSGRTMRALTLTHSLAHESRRPCSPLSLRNLMGQAYTFREPLTAPAKCPECGGGARGCALCGGAGTVQETVSHCTSFKRIDPRDRKVFVSSLLDCLTPELREELLRQLGDTKN